MRYLIVVAAALLLLPMQLHATTWHVYPGQSIQAAIDNANPGEDVVVHSEIFRGYTYYESIILKSGVTVHSVSYEPEVTIDGQDADQTVYFLGNGQGMYFGGPGVGFTIDGGDEYGVWFNGGENIHVEDLIIHSDPAFHAMLISVADETTAHFKNITIEGQTEAFFGLYLSATRVTVENLTVRNMAKTAVCAEWCLEDLEIATLEGVNIQDCDVGVMAWNSFVDIIGGDPPWNVIEDCRIGATTAPYDLESQITAENITFETCETGIGAGGNENSSGVVDAANCLFRYCDTGISSNWGNGTIMNCRFMDISDTGMSIMNSDSDKFVIGGNDPENPDGNEFSYISGTGIHLGSGGRADIGFNDFDHVDGTSILVETGNWAVSIDGCTINGSGCFQGIRTRKLNTIATIRNCEIRDYEDVMVPLPRGVNVSQPSANLGTTAQGDEGNNEFYDNTTDLYYADKGSPPPDPIYAQYCYWGESDPAPESFGGRWADYIIYDPWLTGPPGLAPPIVSDPIVSNELVLEPIHPNPTPETASMTYNLPTSGSVELCIWDVQGRLVKTLVAGEQPAGPGLAEWDGTGRGGAGAPSGVYFCRLKSPAGSATQSFVLMR